MIRSDQIVHQTFREPYFGLGADPWKLDPFCQRERCLNSEKTHPLKNEPTKLCQTNKTLKQQEITWDVNK